MNVDWIDAVMNPVVSTDKIMEEIEQTAALIRKERGVFGKGENSSLKEEIDKAAGLYECRYGQFTGSRVKVFAKKVLSLIIRPAARPQALEQSDFNKSIVQSLKQIQLSMDGEGTNAIKCINESVDQHERSLKKMRKELENLEKD